MSDEGPTLISGGTEEVAEQTQPSEMTPSGPVSDRRLPTGPPRPASSPRPEAPPSSRIGGTSLAHMLALEDEQAVRGRAMAWVGVLVSALSIAALQVPGGQDPTGRWTSTAALGCVLGGSLYLAIADRLGRPVTANRVFGLGFIVTPTVLLLLYHVGAFSPVVMALFVGVYYFGLADSRVQGWVTLGLSAGGYLALVTLTLARVLPADRALLIPQRWEPIAFAAITLVTEVFLVLTFWMARLSRRATRDAMARLEQARRQLDQRDALLHEVRADLQNAIGHKRGRYSDVALGDYVAEDVIGRGAMGEVYRARHIDSARVAAVKVLHPWMLDSHTHVERFFREAEICSELDSPHIVRVFGHGTSADGTPYLVMELLTGNDLGWHLRDRTRLPLSEAIELVDQLAQALTVAWDAGIVHRDLKPKNVFLDEGEQQHWKILDFGVSKLRHGQGTLTAGEAVGTPAYMAPEQAAARDIDHRADVFSLGAIAYRVLTGRPAFAGPDIISTMYQAAELQPVRPSSLARLASDVDRVIALALAKDRDRRLRSANSFAAALRDALRGELDDRFRRDAEALLHEHPWGESRSRRR